MELSPPAKRFRGVTISTDMSFKNSSKSTAVIIADIGDPSSSFIGPKNLDFGWRKSDLKIFSFFLTGWNACRTV
jgi:hypothetical protein